MKVTEKTSKIDSEKIFSQIRTKSDSFWRTSLGKNSLALFAQAAHSVPAYKEYLKKSNIQPSKIKTQADFEKVPPMTKKEYLSGNSLAEMCWPDTLRNKLVFTSTSGSTGEPFYFPRGRDLDWQYSVLLEQFLNNTSAKGESTLIVVCFGMGVWIGGLITYHAFELVNERGNHAVSLITPGVNKKEIFAALKNVAPSFDNVILCGYPPFIKDVIDEGPAHEIDWKKFKMKTLFAAESFTESFRDYIVENAGIKNALTDTMNIYGSAELGAMANETPLSILVRRLALANKTVYNQLFVDVDRTPTLAQFNPNFIQFEAIEKTILVTGNNALPLIRYAIGDHGGVLSFNEVVEIFTKKGIDLLAEAKTAGISKEAIHKLPFVYVYERADLSTKLYGAIIYPEFIKEALSHKELEKFVTGKFTMFTNFTDQQDEYLEINVELKQNAAATMELERMTTKVISDTLKARSAEHKNNAQMMADKVEPRIVFWNHEDPEHFRVGIKQKWVKRS